MKLNISVKYNQCRNSLRFVPELAHRGIVEKLFRKTCNLKFKRDLQKKYIIFFDCCTEVKFLVTIEKVFFFFN